MTKKIIAENRREAKQANTTYRAINPISSHPQYLAAHTPLPPYFSFTPPPIPFSFSSIHSLLLTISVLWASSQILLGPPSLSLRFAASIGYVRAAVSGRLSDRLTSPVAVLCVAVLCVGHLACYHRSIPCLFVSTLFHLPALPSAVPAFKLPAEQLRII